MRESEASEGMKYLAFRHMILARVSFATALKTVARVCNKVQVSMADMVVAHLKREWVEEMDRGLGFRRPGETN